MYEVNSKHRLEGVDYKSSPNRGRRITPTIIVLHDTAGRIEGDSSVRWLTDKKSKASAHVVIGRAGEVTQLVPFDVAAWHAGRSLYKGRYGVNAFGIGIELVNPGKLVSKDSHNTAQAWFKKNYSKLEYGIEFKHTPEHDSGWWMPYTTLQLTHLQLVIDALTAKYAINDITTHYAISPKRKVDVNPLFPINLLREINHMKGVMGGA